MGVFLANAVGFIFAVIMIRFLYLYRKELVNIDSELHKNCIARFPRLYIYMKYAIPVVISGFCLILVNATLAMVAAVMRNMAS